MEICTYCDQPIIGGKGDWWHLRTPGGGYGEMFCDDGKHLATPEQFKEPMAQKKFEYQIVFSKSGDQDLYLLNQAGQKGWELMHIITNENLSWFYMKREIVNDKT